MLERIRESLVTALVLSCFLLVSCSSSVNQGGAQNAPAVPTHVRLTIGPQGLEVAWEPVSGSYPLHTLLGVGAGRLQELGEL